MNQYNRSLHAHNLFEITPPQLPLIVLLLAEFTISMKTMNQAEFEKLLKSHSRESGKTIYHYIFDYCCFFMRDQSNNAIFAFGQIADDRIFSERGLTFFRYSPSMKEIEGMSVFRKMFI